MKHFVVTLVFLAGPPTAEVGEAQQVFVAGLHEQGLLLLAGPFTDGRGGMAVVVHESLEEVQNLYRESPVVRSGSATADVREWNVLLDATKR
ncbi:YciI family protein [Streptomyces fuscichromogenes]|uniref:YciI family protein n=1 Tax=Streptomyces fuscichromogenes TaxID=1324013 RepID=UPI003826D39A